MKDPIKVHNETIGHKVANTLEQIISESLVEGRNMRGHVLAEY